MSSSLSSSSLAVVHCSSKEKLLEGVDVNDGRLVNSGWSKRGDDRDDEGADEETEAGSRTSYVGFEKIVGMFELEAEYEVGLCNRNGV